MERSGLEKDRKQRRKVKGEPEEAAAEIEAGGRRKEIADEACMKLGVWKPKGGNHSFVSGGTNYLIPAPLAQLVEQLTLNQWVPGSSP